MLHQIKQQQYEITTSNFGNAALSNVAKNQQITINPDQLSATGTQGYRSIIGTHGVTQACEPEYHPQVRVGFTTTQCNLDGPVGFDGYGIAIRSVDGSLCTERQRLFTDENYHTVSHQQIHIEPGQVIGCLIHLPQFVPECPLPEETEMCESKSSTKITLKRPEDQIVMQQVNQKQVQDKREIIPGSFMKFYINGTIIAEKHSLPYNRYYAAVSMYNYATIYVNFGLRNIRYNGYPVDFYALSHCLLNQLESEEIPKTLQFGFEKLNLEKIFQVDDEEKRLEQLKKEQELILKSEQTKVQVTIAHKKEDEKTAILQDATQISVSNITSPDQIKIVEVQTTESQQIPETDELTQVLGSITQEDVQKLGCNKIEMKQFLKNIYAHLQGEQHKVNTNIQKHSYQNLNQKGFSCAPKEYLNQITPFTSLYKVRSERDYQLTIQAINDGLYNVFIHNEILKLFHEQERKRGKK